MCGRYALAHTHKEILERFGLEQLEIEFDPRYNIAPSQMVPIILEQRLNELAPPVRTLEQSKWGLVPGWVKDPRLLKPMINARGETLMEKRIFKDAFLKRRCLIPADGFFEWVTINGKKYPVRFQINGGELFAFAGLYEQSKNAEGEIQRTCSIVTVAANEKVSAIHDRMPAILKPDAERLWLSKDDNDPEKLLSLLNPCEDEAIDYYRVSTMVNSPKLDTADCVRELTSEELQAEQAAAETKPKSKRKSSKPPTETESSGQTFLSEELRRLSGKA